MSESPLIRSMVTHPTPTHQRVNDGDHTVSSLTRTGKSNHTVIAVIAIAGGSNKHGQEMDDEDGGMQWATARVSRFRGGCHEEAPLTALRYAHLQIESETGTADHAPGECDEFIGYRPGEEEC